MHVLVFATEKPGGGAASSPFAAVPARADAVLPPHPDGREWTYFATMSADDAMLVRANDRLAAVLSENGHFIWRFPRLKTVAPQPQAVVAPA